jgi:aryl-alcohol dehydrogenase-like predicted oxidoreductase
LVKGFLYLASTALYDNHAVDCLEYAIHSSGGKLVDYRRLGHTGLKISELALGTMQFGWTTDEQSAFQVMDAFVEAGGNLIDTADIYSRWAEGNPGGVSEEIIGRWMKERGNRHDVVLATKVRGRMWEGPNGDGLSRAHIMRAVDASLRRLQTDYIDLYQTHYFDVDTPIAETMRAMDDLVRAGKVRYVGCSNYPAWRLVESLWASDKNGLVSYVSLQPHYNLVHREEFERELATVVEGYGIGVINYSPLAGGFLTGKYRRDAPLPDSSRAEGVQKRYFNERNFDLLDKMEQVGRPHGKGILQVALGWLLTNPLVTSPIIGANDIKQLQASLDAVGFRLNAEEMASLDELST